MNLFLMYLMLLVPLAAFADSKFETPFERSGGTETATYAQGIKHYRALAAAFGEIQMTEQGPTDSGKPLHLVLYSPDGDFDVASNRAKGRTVLLINNAIHPGEPDGVDASMMFVRDIAEGKILNDEKQHLLLAVIPFYNIGGVLNRNSVTRVNQNGPKSYGFRGNARNYDLNRDFIKSDSKNARSFAAIFHGLDPDVMIDTHVSDGADYPYVISMDYPQKDKLGGELGKFLDETMMPFLYAEMKAEAFEMTPYVNAWGKTPDKGWVQFIDWPRYSSGYAALFHTIAFMSETHMLKPFPQRVHATYAYLEAVARFLHQEGQRLSQLRARTKEAVKTRKEFAVTWKPDMQRPTQLDWKGYEPEMLDSKVTVGQRLHYDTKRPFEKKVPYYDNFVPDVVVTKPKAYLFSQAWEKVADLMLLNGVQINRLAGDTTLTVEVIHIEKYDTRKDAYEGHYPHSNATINTRREEMNFRKGDYLIEVNQETNRYIVETLEPQAFDSFFNWNFFDTVLQRKEYFSPYVFEDLAEELLKAQPELRTKLARKSQSDEVFAKSRRAQLDFIYQNSPHAEPEHLRYPVFRLFQ